MTFSPDDISHIDIFPPINIARVGDSSEYFIGPEVPGVEPTPEGGYKDKEYKIKKQAARFRVYAYDKKSKLLGELTSPDYTLTWNVHVANKKGAWFLYRGKYQRETWHLRNKTVQAWQDGNPPDDPKKRREFTNTRKKLIIDPGEKAIEGADAPPVTLEGKFCGSLSSPTLVKLGEIRTDSQGRLLVLPSDGDSFSIVDPAPQELHTQYDNDNWVDKMCDGTVRVTVKSNSQPNLYIPAKNKATIITAPPRFASGTHCPTTLYELIEDIYERSRRREAGSGYDVGDVVYYRDIYPLFKRIYLLSWTSESALDGHGPLKMERFNGCELSDPGADNTKRANLFKTRIRAPVIDGDEENKKIRDKQAKSRYMPQLGGDDEDGPEPTDGVANSWVSLTQLQWDRLKKWSEGNFTIGESEIPYTSFDKIPLDEQPGALTRAALEWSVGASLNPGCEVYWSAQLEEMYNLEDKFRFADTVRPGDIVKGLSLPWQSDFNECDARWWPSIRPGEVVTEDYFQEIKRVTPPEQIDQLASKLTERSAWSRGANSNSGMVREWNKLGFVARQSYGDSPDLPDILVERQRHPTI